MAKLSFYEVKIMRFPTTDEEGREIPNADPVTIDSVHLEISKKVRSSTMRGEKTESYIVPVSELPVLFGKDWKIPPIDGNHVTGYSCDKRIEAVVKYLEPYVGKECYAEDIMKTSNGKSRKVLTYIEFNN